MRTENSRLLFDYESGDFAASKKEMFTSQHRQQTTKTMKDLKLRATLGIGLAASFLATGLASAATLFEADFNGTESLANPANITTLLDNTTSTGSWSNFSSGTGSPAWGIQQNATATNGALLLDLGTGMSIQADFASTANFATQNLTVGFSMYPIRGGAAKSVFVDFYDSNDNLVYGIDWVPIGANPTANNVSDTINGTTYSSAFENIGATIVTTRGAGGYDPSATDDVSIVFSGTAVTINGTGSSQTLPSSEIAYFVVDTGGAAGIAFDDLVVTGVPEPSSAALLGLAGLALILRRRR